LTKVSLDHACAPPVACLSRQKAFEDAGEAFDDPFAIDFIDDREDYGEDRFILLGIVDNRLLVVAHTLRDDKPRIVSACECKPLNPRRP
jgi:uncharacterized protein